ncbi:MAG: dihydroneopterin aldolase [Methanobacteriota archaeon]
MSEKTGDRTFLRDLTARCIIGDNDSEREKQQELVLNIELWTDHRQAAATDALEDALDYRAVKKDVLAYVENSEHRLIEALAEHVARICLKDSRVERARVTVDKPGTLRFARSVAVQVDRGRS